MTGKILQKKDFEILDSIRGIASLYVAIAHCRGTLWMGGSEYVKMFPRNTWDAGDYLIFGGSMLTRLAVEFVIVFFVLSGFSIAHSLSGNKSAFQFYKRRFIRIYPSYVIALVWAGIIFIVTCYWHPQWYDGSLQGFSFERTPEMNNFFSKTSIINNLLYMPGRGFIFPFWSLTYEVMFYLLAPFILRKVNYYIVISAGLFIFNLFFPAVVSRVGLNTYLYEFVFLYNIYFVIGVTLYAKYKTVTAQLDLLNKKQMLIVLAGLLLATYGINLYFKIETVFSFLSAAFLSVFMIIFFVKYQVRIPFLMKVGGFSYTLYITHYSSVFLYLGLYWLIFKPDAAFITNYFVWIPAVFFVLLMAWLQYHLIEKKTKTILNKLRTKVAGS